MPISPSKPNPSIQLALNNTSSSKPVSSALAVVGMIFLNSTQLVSVLLIIPLGPFSTLPTNCVPQRLTCVDNTRGFLAFSVQVGFSQWVVTARDRRRVSWYIYSPGTFPMEIPQADCCLWWKATSGLFSYRYLVLLLITAPSFTASTLGVLMCQAVTSRGVMHYSVQFCYTYLHLCK